MLFFEMYHCVYVLLLYLYVLENGIPFEIKLDKPNAETLQAMQDVREGKNLHGPFNSLSELMEDLNADD